MKTVGHEWECRDSFYAASDIVLDRAKGFRLWDTKGREYLDLCSGFGALAFGHQPEYLKNVWTEYFDNDWPIHGMGDVYRHQHKLELLHELAAITPPSIEKFSLALTGSQAIEIALKTAMLATGRHSFIAFEGGYHGLDTGALQLSGMEKFKNGFIPWLHEAKVKILPFNQEIKVDSSFDPNEIAGIVFEPIQGRGGIIEASKEFLDSLEFFAKKHGILLIADEILTGFGRTGKMFCSEDRDIDILVMGKALGGGMPISACGAKKDVMDAWPKSQGEAMHTGTFFGHPLSCKIATKTLQHMRSVDLLGMVQKNHDRFTRRSSFPIWGKGLMLGIKAPYSIKEMEEKGIIALPCSQGGFSLTPALNFDLQDEFFDRLSA
jgi:acetylornithine/succinyldiaminopimelate/putrescine aminotransferase